jgi:elongation factor G
MERGFLAGYELVDIKVRLVDGNYHEVDSDERSFHIAGSLAFQDACERPSRFCSSRSCALKW